METKCKKLEANAKESRDLAAALVAHQGFRASCLPDAKTSAAALSADAAKQLESDFIKDRAPMIAAVAHVKDLRVKLEEFVKRGWDQLQVQAKQSGGGGGPDVATMGQGNQHAF